MKTRWAALVAMTLGAAAFAQVAPAVKETAKAVAESTQQAGDHTIFIAEVEDVVVREGEPLLFFRGQYRKMSESQPGQATSAFKGSDSTE